MASWLQTSESRAVSKAFLLLALLAVDASTGAQEPSTRLISEQVSFPNGGLTLRGTVYKPEGEGPFPAMVYNHGSAPGALNDLAFEQLGPLFVERGWVFFAPYRRGQGLSADAGRYVGDDIRSVTWQRAGGTLLLLASGTVAFTIGVVFVMRRHPTWIRASSAVAVSVTGAVACLMIGVNARSQAVIEVLRRTQLTDHFAAYQWLESQAYVDSERIATGGNSFGGIITVLAAPHVAYCAAVDAAGGAETWSTPVAEAMIEAVRQSKAPIFLFQAANDFSIEPTQRLGEEMRRAGRPYESKIYSAFGQSAQDGHSFAWRGSAVWADEVFRFLTANCK